MLPLARLHDNPIRSSTRSPSTENRLMIAAGGQCLGDDLRAVWRGRPKFGTERKRALSETCWMTLTVEPPTLRA